MDIKDYVYNYRKEHGLSMQAFGKKCGLSRAYISILEKGINPTTGKPFVPGLATIKRIADCTGVDIEYLIKMLDGDKSVIVNHISTSTTNAKAILLSKQEILLIQRYRQLDADGKEDVEDFVAMKLVQAQRKAKEAMTSKEKEEALG